MKNENRIVLIIWLLFLFYAVIIVPKVDWHASAMRGEEFWSGVAAYRTAFLWYTVWFFGSNLFFVFAFGALIFGLMGGKIRNAIRIFVSGFFLSLSRITDVAYFTIAQRVLIPYEHIGQAAKFSTDLPFTQGHPVKIFFGKIPVWNDILIWCVLCVSISAVIILFPFIRSFDRKKLKL